MGMRSWVLSIASFICIVGSLTGVASGQGDASQNANPKPVAQPTSADQRAFKEVKFKVEWTVRSLGTGSNAPSANPDSEAITITSAEGQTTMTTNPVPGEDKFRRITLHSELQPDGSYLVNLNVIDLTKDQDIPRLDTVVKVRTSETKVVQDRISKGSNYNYQYQVTITPVIE